MASLAVAVASFLAGVVLVSCLRDKADEGAAERKRRARAIMEVRGMALCARGWIERAPDRFGE